LSVVKEVQEDLVDAKVDQPSDGGAERYCSS
jgi:hypothetical protein